jgi:hypothetical protein
MDECAFFFLFERQRERIKEGKVRGGGFRLRMGNWELRREKRIKK